MPAGWLGVVGADRERLDALRSAAITALGAIESIRPLDPLAGDARTSLRLGAEFLRNEFIPSIDEVLRLDALTRPIPIGRIGEYIRLLADGLGPTTPTAGDAPTDPGVTQLTLDALLAEAMRMLALEGAANDLDDPFWTGTGAATLDEIRRRLIEDPTSIDHFLAMPASIALIGLLLAEPLDTTTTARLATAVLATPFPGTIVDTELAAAAVEHARIALLDPAVAEVAFADPNATEAMLRRGHVTASEVGEALGGLVDRLAADGWPDARSLDLLRSLATVAAREPLGGDTAPTELAMPVATLGVALTPMLAAGRLTGGRPNLYPAGGGSIDTAEPLDRNELRELIGLALGDEAGAATIFVGLRDALREAVGDPDNPALAVDRIDEIARIVDEAAVEEHAEAAARASAQATWVTSMLGGLDRPARRLAASGGLPMKVAVGAGVDVVQRIGASLVDVDDLPIDGVRTYYEMARTFEIARHDVLAVDATTLGTDVARLGAARSALAAIEERIDLNLDGAVDDANRAWLAFETASAPFVDITDHFQMDWNDAPGR